MTAADQFLRQCSATKAKSIPLSGITHVQSLSIHPCPLQPLNPPTQPQHHASPSQEQLSRPAYTTHTSHTHPQEVGSLHNQQPGNQHSSPVQIRHSCHNPHNCHSLHNPGSPQPSHPASPPQRHWPSHHACRSHKSRIHQLEEDSHRNQQLDSLH